MCQRQINKAIKKMLIYSIDTLSRYDDVIMLIRGEFAFSAREDRSNLMRCINNLADSYRLQLRSIGGLYEVDKRSTATVSVVPRSTLFSKLIFD